MKGGKFIRAWATLTPRQREVLRLRSQGYSCRQVAARKDITDTRVRSIIREAHKKLPTNGCDPQSRSLWVSYMIGKLGLEG